MTMFINQQTVYFVDDDEKLREANMQSLELAGLDVREFADAESALAAINVDFSGVLVSDIRMPRMDGLKLFEHVRAIDPSIPIILITGHADVAMAIGALKAGAFDFLTKPFAADHLVATIRRALETRRLVIDNRLLREAADRADSPLIGDSPAMTRLRHTIMQVAQADVDVLVEGETGTGKELVALLLHRKGPRRVHPFIAVNCGALPEALAEVELFGHTHGSAGYGARGDRIGPIEMSSNGTLFLDEIDSMPLPVQAKLLRVLEEREVTPIGGSRPKPVNLRVIAAAKGDLEILVKAGAFRNDLFYRLDVVRLRVPTLRERSDDILQLFVHFVDEASAKLGAETFVMTDHIRRQLVQHDWPGNVRELRNFAFRAVLDLPQELSFPGMSDSLPLPDRVAQFEETVLRDALEATNGNINKVLALLKIPRKTLYDKLVRHGIDAKPFRNGS